MAFKSMDISATSTPANSAFTVDGSIIIGIQAANTSTTNSLKVDVTLRGKYIVRGAPIPMGSALPLMEGKMVANNTDVLEVTTDGEPVDVIVSYLEV